MKYIGVLPSAYDIVPMSFNKDGTITAVRKQDKRMEQEINSFIQAIKKEIQPMIQFIAEDIFHGQDSLIQSISWEDFSWTGYCIARISGSSRK